MTPNPPQPPSQPRCRRAAPRRPHWGRPIAQPPVPPRCPLPRPSDVPRLPKFTGEREASGNTGQEKHKPTHANPPAVAAGKAEGGGGIPFSPLRMSCAPGAARPAAVICRQRSARH